MRGNTQALAVTTLAAPGAEQLIETMEISGKRRFMLIIIFRLILLEKSAEWEELPPRSWTWQFS